MNAEESLPQSNIKPDPELAIQFLEAHFHRPHYDICAIHDGHAPIARSLQADEVEGFILEHNSRGANVYFSPSLIRDRLNKKATKRDVSAVVGIAADIDGDQGIGWEQLLEDLIGADVPMPSLVWKTGSGGIQAMWMFPEPVAIVEEGTVHRIETLGKKIASVVGGDHTHNIDRVLRLPGTVNHPNMKKREKGRFTALSEVIPTEGRGTYSLESLEDCFKDVNVPDHAKSQKSARSFDIDVTRARQICAQIESTSSHALSVLPKECKSMLRNGIALLESDRSRGLFHFVRKCLSVRIPPEVVMGCLLATRVEKKGVPQNRSLFSHIAEQSESPEKYIHRQIAQVSTKLSGHTDRFQTTENGTKLSCVHNTEIALKMLGVSARLNAFTREVEIETSDTSERLSDELFHDLKNQMDCRFSYRPSADLLRGHLLGIATGLSYDPIVERFSRLPPWDGQKRLDRLFPDYFGAEDTSFNRAAGEVLMTAIVRRQYVPGAKFDLMFILQGPQGWGKSTSLRALCLEPEWFQDGFQLNAKAKEIIEISTAKVLMEADELDGLTVGASTTIKSNLSRQSDKARLAFGRFATERKRRFVNVGTTNEKQFLRDSTGNRRFPVITIVRSGSPDALRRDREQIWAEAIQVESLSDRNVAINIPEEYWGTVAEIAEECSIIDPWEEILLNKGFGSITGLVPKIEVYGALGLIDDRSQKVTPRDSKRIATTMSRLGFEQSRPTCSEGVRVRCWRNSASPDSREFWKYCASSDQFKPVKNSKELVATTRRESHAVDYSGSRGEQ